MASKKGATRSGETPTHSLYLVQFSYTHLAWKQMLAKPLERDRVKAVDRLVTALGGCFPVITVPCGVVPRNGKYMTFGDRDITALLAFPSDIAATAFAMTIAAGGWVQDVKTTKLMAWSQAMQAFQAAASAKSTYTPSTLI